MAVVIRTILTVLFAIDCIALVVVVLMQQGKDQGLGALAGGRLSKLPGETSRRLEEDAYAKGKYDATAAQDARIIERVAELARLHGVSMTEIALAWLIHKGAIPVAGATKLSHVEGAARATEQALTEEEVAYLEACYTPHALVGVMAQNTREAADRPGVWSQNTPKV